MAELVVDTPANITEEMKRLLLNQREIVESILNRSKLKEKDAEEIDNIVKLDLFEKYYQTSVGSIQIGD